MAQGVFVKAKCRASRRRDNIDLAGRDIAQTTIRQCCEVIVHTHSAREVIDPIYVREVTVGKLIFCEKLQFTHSEKKLLFVHSASEGKENKTGLRDKLAEQVYLQYCH